MRLSKLFSWLMIVVLIAVLLPVTALAAKPMTFDVTFRNQTGSPAELKLIDSIGNVRMVTVAKGVSTLTLPEGKHDFWISSACGNTAGSWNLNVNKVFFIQCSALGVHASSRTVAGLAKGSSSCSDYGFYYRDPSGGADYWVFVSQTYWADPFKTWATSYSQVGLYFTNYGEACYDSIWMDSYFSVSPY